MNVRCIETCYLDGNYYEPGREYVLELPKKHPSWAYFESLGQAGEVPEQGKETTGKAGKAPAK